MAFEISTFRKLLYQNALEDAIQALRMQGSKEYEAVSDQIESQLVAWQKSTHWNPFGYRKSSKNHQAILHNLYISGLAASKKESPPALKNIHPWTPLLFGYTGMIGLVVAGIFTLTYHAPCPEFDPDKPISILIDHFAVDDEPLFAKVGIQDNFYETFFKNALRSNSIATAVHPVGVSSQLAAKEKCNACGANMLVYGRGSLKAHIINVHYYLQGENYYDYKLKYGFPELEVKDNSFFDPRIDQWSSDIQCIVHLFAGLLKKEAYKKETNSEKKDALIREIDAQFTDALGCIRDDSLSVYAMHCLAWAKLEQDQQDAAQNLYQKILTINPADPLALNNSGQLFTQDSNFLYANIRYEALLKENDLPYVRIANAKALTKLDRREEADKEVQRVKETPEYKIHKDVFDRQIRKVEMSRFTPETGSVGTLTPSAYLDVIAHRFSAGDRDGAMRGLDSLSIHVDTARMTAEDVSIMRSFYKNAGAVEKVEALDIKATQMQMIVPPPSETVSKATMISKRQH